MVEQIDQGNYEILRRRLDEQARTLVERTGQLDEARKKTFGGSELAVVANERVRTENNCVPRDLVSFRGTLVMGYKVFLGLRAETQVHDVLSLHRFVRTDDGSWDLSEVPRDTIPGFLNDPRFLKEFGDLFKYYRETKLLQLRVESDRILAIFQTGATLSDQRVLRWAVDATAITSFRTPSTSSGRSSGAINSARAGTLTSRSRTSSSWRPSTAISRSRSRTTPRPDKASTPSRSRTRIRRSTTPRSSTPRSAG
jgi:hypothetical protein